MHPLRACTSTFGLLSSWCLTPTACCPPRSRQVHKFNGTPVRNLKHLTEMVLTCKEQHMRFDVDYSVSLLCCMYCLYRLEAATVLPAACAWCLLACPSWRAGAWGPVRAFVCCLLAPQLGSSSGALLQEVIVIDTAVANEATEEILRLHSIPAMGSKDLQEVLASGGAAVAAAAPAADGAQAAGPAAVQQEAAVVADAAPVAAEAALAAAEAAPAAAEAAPAAAEPEAAVPVQPAQ